MVETERFPSLLQRTFGGTAPRVPGLAPEMAFALVDGLGPVGMHYVAITNRESHSSIAADRAVVRRRSNAG